MRSTSWLARAVAQVPASVHVKLLAAFLVTTLLLIVLGTVGLDTLLKANLRAEELLRLQRNISTYRQLQHDATVQQYNVASALMDPERQSLDSALRQLYVYGYDVDRLRVTAKEDAGVLAEVLAEYQSYIAVVDRVVALIQSGRTDEGRKLLQNQAAPIAESIERRMNELVNRAEQSMLESVDTAHVQHEQSQRLVLGLAGASCLLSLLLGFSISNSLIPPVKEMDRRLAEIASGDFSRHVDVVNRDELGTLAANLNVMNDKLGRLYQELELVSRHKSDFLANMSHELRTPLNAIIGFSEALLERMFGELNAKQEDYLQDIHASGHHLLALINDVLDLSKIEAGHMELHRERFDVADMLDAASTLVRERAMRHGIELTLEIDPGMGEIEADERKIKQVVLNLLTNAVKFTPDGGSVWLRGRRLVDRIEISIQDTGVGIAPEDQEIVFEEFRQVGQNYTHKQEGTGLGLALTKRIVELHGGEVALESVLGQGSTFAFTLPVPTDESDPDR